MPQIGKPITDATSKPLSGKAALMASPNRPTFNHPYSNPAPAPTTITDSSSEPATEPSRPTGNYNTAPAANGLSSNKHADEFGYNRARGISVDQSTGRPQVQTIGVSQTSSNGRPNTAENNNSGSAAVPRPRSSGGRQAVNSVRPLTVANYADDMPEEVQAQIAAAKAASAANRTHSRQPSATARAAVSGATPRAPGWLPAEEEKKLLYERAKAQVELVQGSGSGSQSPPIVSLHIHISMMMRLNTPLFSDSLTHPYTRCWSYIQLQWQFLRTTFGIFRVANSRRREGQTLRRSPSKSSSGARL